MWKVVSHVWEKNRNERPSVGDVCIRSRDGALSRKTCVVNSVLTWGQQQLSMTRLARGEQGIDRTVVD